MWSYNVNKLFKWSFGNSFSGKLKFNMNNEWLNFFVYKKQKRSKRVSSSELHAFFFCLLVYLFWFNLSQLMLTIDAKCRKKGEPERWTSGYCDVSSLNIKLISICFAFHELNDKWVCYLFISHKYDWSL